MGRPTASKENKQFGVFFANVVTVPVESRSTTVARSGEGAIFYIFAQCFPDLVRTNSRNGLTQLEFNKYLQTNDFPLIRKRNRSKTCMSPRKKLAFFPPSSFRFSGRRWRNPDNLEDLAYLRSAWPIVTKGLNAITFEGFCDAVREAIALDDQMGEMIEMCSDTMSACSTPRATKRCKVDFSDSDDVSDSEEGEAAEEMPAHHFPAEDHLLDLPLVDNHEIDHHEPCFDVAASHAEFELEPVPVGQKRRRSEKWIDAQTFLEQCKSEAPCGFGLEFPELWGLVHGSGSHEEAISCA